MPSIAPELAAAMAESRRYREGIGREIERLEEEAELTSPSKASEIKRSVAGRLRRLLDDA